MTLFHDKQDFRFYRKLWRQAKKSFNLRIFRWCIMSNHIHFIVRQVDDRGISEAMHYIQQRYAKYYGRRYKWIGHVWQGRFTSRLIADDIYLRHCANYVEDNPVRAGIVLKAEDYLWSSAYARHRGFHDGMVDPFPLPEESPPPEMSGKVEDPWKKGRRVLGEADAIEKLKLTLGDSVVKKRGRPRIERK